MPPDDGLFIQLTREDFEAMSQKEQAWAIFGTVKHLAGQFDALNQEGCKRFRAEAVKHTALSALSGLAGGVLTVLGKGKLW